MDVYLATSLHHIHRAPRLLTHHCGIVEKETKADLAYRQSSYSPRATLAPSFTGAPQ
jgi:hypothetical protein